MKRERERPCFGILRAVRLAGKDVAGAAAGTVLTGNNAAAAGPSISSPASSPAKTAHPNTALELVQRETVLWNLGARAERRERAGKL